MLILVKPRDRYDVCDTPALEHVCMTFAALKGINVSRTALYPGPPSTLLIKRFDRTPLDLPRRIPMLSALLSVEAATAVLDEIAGWETDLRAHYRQHLGGAELELALAAVGAHRLT